MTNPNHSALANIPTRPGTPVRGIYRVVTAERVAHTRDGRPAVRLRIADASDSRLCAFYTNEDSTLFDRLSVGTLIAIEGHVARSRRMFGAPFWVRLTRCKPIETADRPSWALFPIVEVPDCARSAFTRMQGILNRLTDPALRGFMDRVMGNPTLARRFAQFRGHPADGPGEPGRLLIDSVARAEKAERIAHKLLDRRSAELVIVGAMLKHVGLIYEDGAYIGQVDESLETMNVFVLEDAFIAIEQESWHCALALYEILAPETAVEASGCESRTLCKDLVRWSDQLDTAARFRHEFLSTSTGANLASVTLHRQ